ncbi:hypothetical protein V8F33_002821 [Rhypophila sp. PSN 637]
MTIFSYFISTSKESSNPFLVGKSGETAVRYAKLGDGIQGICPPAYRHPGSPQQPRQQQGKTQQHRFRSRALNCEKAKAPGLGGVVAECTFSDGFGQVRDVVDGELAFGARALGEFEVLDVIYCLFSAGRRGNGNPTNTHHTSSSLQHHIFLFTTSALSQIFGLCIVFNMDSSSLHSIRCELANQLGTQLNIQLNTKLAKLATHIDT